MKPDRDLKEPKEWLEKSWHDLAAAKTLLTEDGFPDTIAFALPSNRGEGVERRIIMAGR